jgi:DNA-binding LytR/AlgR family response regulator
MNIIIIEDEQKAALDLKDSIESLRPDFNILAVLDSVETALEWFAGHSSPDLIFSDIQLGDGLSFDIFGEVAIRCPVIFCTAYDAYAIQAFEHNGIDYLLKPITGQALEKSLRKVDLFAKSIHTPYDPAVLYNLLSGLETHTKKYKRMFLVHYREKMIPIPVAQIACFSINSQSVLLHTLDNKQYPIPYTLDYLEAVIDPQLFYRANRQHLLAYHAVKEVEPYFDRKLLVKLTLPGTDPVIISKAKASDFLKWLENR